MATFGRGGADCACGSPPGRAMARKAERAAVTEIERNRFGIIGSSVALMGGRTQETRRGVTHDAQGASVECVFRAEAISLPSLRVFVARRATARARSASAAGQGRSRRGRARA